MARSCPWATSFTIADALQATGGRGEDAIELLVAAKDEPALAENGKPKRDVDENCSKPDEISVAENSADVNGVDGRLTTKYIVTGESGEGISNGNGKGGKKSSPPNGGEPIKPAKKVTRGSDCPCGSGLKYKKCCRKKDAAIARGQIPAPGDGSVVTTAGDASTLADDLGSLVI